jgi:hypothetical protein
VHNRTDKYRGCVYYSVVWGVKEMFRRSVHPLQPESLGFRPALRKKEQETRYALDNFCGVSCLVALGSRHVLHVRRVHQHSVGSGRRGRFDQVHPEPKDHLLNASPTTCWFEERAWLPRAPGARAKGSFRLGITGERFSFDRFPRLKAHSAAPSQRFRIEQIFRSRNSDHGGQR